MKGLENLFRQTGKFLASAIAATALYTSAQEPTKIEVEQDGSWKKISDVTLYFQSTTGSQGRDPAKNHYNQSKAKACFIGRTNPDGSFTISYLTTDPEKPSRDAAYASFNSSYVSFLSKQNLEAEVSQRTILMDDRGEIFFEKADLKENLTCPLIWIGQKIYEKADEYDPVKKLGDESGFFNGGTLDIIKNYADSFGRTSQEVLEKTAGKEVSINPVPKKSRTSWTSTTKREIGTESTLTFFADAEGKAKISVYYDVGLMREKDAGRTRAYTETFEVKISARKTETQTPKERSTDSEPHALYGIWKSEEGGFQIAIDTRGIGKEIRFGPDTLINFKLDSQNTGTVQFEKTVITPGKARPDTILEDFKINIIDNDCFIISNERAKKVVRRMNLDYTKEQDGSLYDTFGRRVR